MQPDALYEKLLESGYSEDFAERAIPFMHLFSGNVEHFIGLVEELIEAKDKQGATASDAGARKVEHDYTGDNLTTGGYDHVDQNHRW